MNNNSNKILTFIIGHQRFAISLKSVERIIRAQFITKFKETTNFVDGIIDYHGDIIAVINLRKRLGYPVHDINISDRFIIVKTYSRKLALIVDEVEDVILPEDHDLFDSNGIDKGLKFINIFRDESGIVLIYDIENLLSESEDIELEKLIESNFSENNNHEE